MKDKFSEDDRKALEDAIKAKQTWMDENGASAAKDDIDEQRQELEEVAKPIMEKINGGGAKEEGGESKATKPEEEENEEL